MSLYQDVKPLTVEFITARPCLPDNINSGLKKGEIQESQVTALLAQKFESMVRDNHVPRLMARDVEFASDGAVINCRSEDDRKFVKARLNGYSYICVR